MYVYVHVYICILVEQEVRLLHQLWYILMYLLMINYACQSLESCAILSIEI